MNVISKGEEARRLLLELELILKEHGEVNWIRGIEAAVSELTRNDEAGFESARSIYKTMNDGGRGFAEYSFWSDDEDYRIAINKDIDHLRANLWNAFGL